MSESYNHHHQTMYLTNPTDGDNPFANEPHITRRASSAPTYTSDLNTATTITAVPITSKTPTLPPRPIQVDQKQPLLVGGVVPSYTGSTITTVKGDGGESTYGYSHKKKSTITLPFAIPHSIQATLSALNVTSKNNNSPPPTSFPIPTVPYTPTPGCACPNHANGVYVANGSEAPPLPKKKIHPAKKIAKDFGKGIAIITVAPLCVAGAGVAAAGGIIYGCGLLLRGIGGALTCGLIHKAIDSD
ncbi:hypothetical protein BDN72DRAFT_96362 [Pluteus cervinus]|uniref:Uncharacterized protein n=1 Tax=Pluteus cervinus TaxID=181527 RepID=A0ACD3ANJ1_9AGAR|nr:hypothetical protein BDN72DRAFT_96362 [Pluteus cervinus]